MKNFMFQFVAVVLLVCNFVALKSVDNKQNTENYVTILQQHVNDTQFTEPTIDLNNLTTRFEMPCETPNRDIGVCIPIKQCSVLMKVLFKPNAKKFLFQSKCGDDRDITTNPKVCCGKLGHFVKKEGNPLPKVCGQQNPVMNTRIFGGTEANLGEFPWMARLIHESSHGFRTFGCSGFLISPKFVVTAAHCLVSESLKIRGNVSTVRFGEHNIRSEVDCTPDNSRCAPPPVEIRVADVISHPKYNNISHHNDIGLIHLKKTVIYTDFIKPICLQEKKDYVVYDYYVSGWGRTETENTSNVKLKVEIPRFDKASCKKRYDDSSLEIIDSQICAGGQKNKDSCVGDSGGPLMMTPNGTVWFASGLVSYGISCGELGWPGIYTSIPHMLPWIKQEIKKHAMCTLGNP